MKAFLMAAGKGTRLKPLTDNCPKCMMDINGKPLLQIWLQNLEKYGIEEVLINTHYLHGIVENFISQYKSRIKIKTIYEKTLLGSAGTIKKNRNFVKKDKEFLVVYADNLTNINLTEMICFHREKRKEFDQYATIGLFETSRQKECGIASINKEGQILAFMEKPKNPKSNLANAGIYIFEKKIFDLLDKIDKPFSDIGFDLLPLLEEKMMGLKVPGYIKDIGSLTNYHEAVNKWKEIGGI